MKNLPENCLAVSNTEKLPFLFEFKGEKYKVTPDKNIFSTLHAAAEKAADNTVTKILFSAGEHSVDKFVFKKPLVLMGQNAGINPNVFGKTRTAAPKLNPERKQNETVFTGSFWFGKMWIEAPLENVTLDGFTLKTVRICDEVTVGSENLHFKNLIFEGACGDHIFKLMPCDKNSVHSRKAEFKNIRFSRFNGLDYGKNFVLGQADELVFDGVCFTDTDKIFGLTDIARQLSTCPENAQSAKLTVKNSYFKNTSGEHAISFFASGGKALDITLKNSVFIDASKPTQPPFMPKISGGSFKADNCIFKETRGEKKCAVLITGSCETEFKSCKISGFTSFCELESAGTKKAPPSVKNCAHTTKCEDPHTVIDVKYADFSSLDRLYRGRKVYYGDLHAHSNSGGKSDGKTPIEDYTKEMDKLSIDFTALVDHRQMRGYFLPAWDKERFIYGMEPGTRLSWAKGAHKGYDRVHYCMLFPNEYGLAMVFANFPEFEFRGDELNGFCKYPVFSKERWDELVCFINSVGGLIVHPHPKDLMSSEDPLDYCFGEHTFLETISVSAWDNMSYKNYELWNKILRLGKHVYTSGGADAHGKITNNAVSTFYTKEKSGLAFFKQMKSGDFTVGFAGIKMCIDKSPMGSEISYEKGQILTVKAGDFFPPHYHKDHIYELRVFTDKGLAYSSVFSGKATQKLAIRVKRRRYYRADIFDVTAGYTAAISNPIWLDKKR